MTVRELITIAKFLKTSHSSKKHGGYDIYENEYIKISYDTYCPNVRVYVKMNEQCKLVLLHSGRGCNHQEHHPGAWEKYVTNVLYPKALEAKKLAEAKEKQDEQAEYLKKFGAVDDKHIFEGITS